MNQGKSICFQFIFTQLFGMLFCNNWLIYKFSPPLLQFLINENQERAYPFTYPKTMFCNCWKENETPRKEYWSGVFNPESESEVTQSCPALCDPMDCSLSGSSIHGIFQAILLEWIAISFSRDLPNPGIEPGSPALQANSLPSELWGKLNESKTQKIR